MAEAISVISSLITLAGFAFQASKSLYQTIESFKSVKRTIREFRSDLESLIQVLANLREVTAQNEVEFAVLKLPLLRCGKICKEFEEIINNWYRGGDIMNLRATLAGYKATIGIALGGATFRQAAVTAGVLDEYKQMVEEAKSDLREYLENIDERLQLLFQRRSAHGRDSIDLNDIKEEKESTEQCLRIWDQYGGETPPPKPEQTDATSCNAEMTTKAILFDFRSRLSENSATLNARLMELNEKLHASSLAERARTNLFEDVESADYSHQLVVSTIGDLISAKRIVTGASNHRQRVEEEGESEKQT
ncbi:hypothetical protein FE257_004349 [Aspergillus nanangensis]|uniref:Azaphilone pigments biosynthesis cluster protein L N-terminal domain-containing protein n=1 Tax=Aspergillus nanangensis TaxID=2582783 RepID=A0AAD4CBV4_ASPNN|nr:hypothetical protein FE257_004349 [Aspergillus nanangensis]